MDNEEKIEVIENVLQAIGEDARIDSAYSGRGMYGEICFALRVPNSSEAHRAIEQASQRGLNGARTDSMGRGIVVYWPSVKGDEKHWSQGRN